MLRAYAVGGGGGGSGGITNPYLVANDTPFAITDSATPSAGGAFKVTNNAGSTLYFLVKSTVMQLKTGAAGFTFDSTAVYTDRGLTFSENGHPWFAFKTNGQGTDIEFYNRTNQALGFMGGSITWSASTATFIFGGAKIFCNSGGIFAHLGGTGTSLTSSDIVPSAGWGSTATVTAITAVDWTGKFTITTGGTGIAANPTIAITYKTAYGANNPQSCVALLNTSSDATAFANVTTANSTTTVLTIRYQGLPITGNTYVFSYIVHGN